MAESGDICFACGQPEHQCTCAVVREQLRLQADGLTRAGHQAMERRELHRAAQIFKQAVGTDRATAGAWAGLGLSSLALGDTGLALVAWSIANAQMAVPPIDAWIADLTSGKLHRALTVYNSALSHAKAENWHEALQEIAEVLSEFPDFVPAGRLKGLVLAGAGRFSEAVQAWSEALDRCRDDSILRKYVDAFREQLAAASPSWPPSIPARRRGVTVAFVAGILFTVLVLRVVSPGARVQLEPQPSSVPASAAVSPTPRFPTSEGTLEIAFTDREDSLVALVRAIGKDTAQWSVTARRRASALVHKAGWRHYDLGVAAARRSNLTVAIAELEIAVQYGQGAYYHDDALYALAQLYSQAGNDSGARTTAILLLQEYPGSSLANSIMRRLAGRQRNR